MSTVMSRLVLRHARPLHTLAVSKAQQLGLGSVIIRTASTPASASGIRHVQTSADEQGIQEDVRKRPQGSSVYHDAQEPSQKQAWPAPQVDYDLFQDPSEGNGNASMPVDMAAGAYHKPSMAALLSSLLLRSDTRPAYHPLYKKISPDDEAAAFSELEKMLAIGEHIGEAEPRGVFEAAACVALEHRDTQSALTWLSVSEDFKEPTDPLRRSEIKTMLQFLDLLHEKAMHDPEEGKAIFFALLHKGWHGVFWHGKAKLQKPLLRVLKELYAKSKLQGGIEALWDEIRTQTTLPAHKRWPVTNTSQRERRAFLTAAFNSAVNLLVLSWQNEAAAKLLKRSMADSAKRHPPVGQWTYELFLRKALLKGGNLELARDVQNHVKTLANRLARARIPNRSRGPLRFAIWTTEAARELKYTGNKWLAMYAKSFEKTEVESVSQQPRSGSPDRDLAGSSNQWRTLEEEVVDMRIRLLEDLELLQGGIWNDRISELSAFQGKLRELERQSSSPAPDPLQAPTDDVVQKEIQGLECFRGLWEYAWMWHLQSKRQYNLALRYYRRTFRPAQWAPENMLAHIASLSGGELEPRRRGIASQVSCHHETCLLHVVVRSLIGEIQSCLPLMEGDINEEGIQIVQTRLQLMEGCYQSIFKPLLEAVQFDDETQLAAAGTVELHALVKNLLSFPFYVWIKAFRFEYGCLAAWNGTGVSDYGDASDVGGAVSATDVATAVNRLEIFRNRSSEDNPLPQTVAAATLRVLQLFDDMQKLKVRPFDARVQLLQTLANDVHNCWSLLEFLMVQWGLTPPRDALSRQSQAELNYELAYDSILKGFLRIAQNQGGAKGAMPYARQIREWLQEMDASQPSTAPKEKDAPQQYPPDYRYGTMSTAREDLNLTLKQLNTLEEHIAAQEQRQQASEGSSGGRQWY